MIDDKPTMTPATSSIGKLAAALALAQAEFAPVQKSRTVKVQTRERGSYTFSYAPLDEVIAATRPALAKQGLAVTQLLVGQELVTMLIHSSGEGLVSRLTLPPLADKPQALGSAITYLRRYALQAMLGVAAEEDDDGNVAEGHQRDVTPRHQKSAPARDGALPPGQAFTPGAPAEAASGAVSLGAAIKAAGEVASEAARKAALERLLPALKALPAGPEREALRASYKLALTARQPGEDG